MQRTTIEQPLLKNGKPTIALLLGSLSSAYHEGIMWGAQDLAKQRDCNVLTFCGGAIKNPNQYAQTRDTIFELISEDYIDGIIITESSHTRFLNHEEKHDYLKRFSPIPLVSIGGSSQDYINIVTDYEPGYTELMSHLINKHGYRKIALFRGPENHTTSTDRLEIYKRCLEEHGIEYDEDLVVSSDLTEIAAFGAVDELFEKREKTCDAIICMNDFMANGTIRALNKKGFSVPEDIAVCGNLDSPLCLFTNPPLTSVRESAYDLGYKALKSLLNKMHGRKNEKQVLVPSSLSIRQSCGCQPLDLQVKEVSGKSLNELMDNCLEKIIVKPQIYHSHYEKESLNSLIKELNHAITREDSSNFLHTLTKGFQDAMDVEEFSTWYSITNEIIRTVIKANRLLSDSQFIGEFLDELLHLKEIYEYRLIIFLKEKISHFNNSFNNLVNSLNRSFDMNTIRSYAIDLLNISDIYLSLYIMDKDKIKGSTNVLSVKNRDFILPRKEERELKPKQLIPSSIEGSSKRFSLIILPLSYRKKPLGFMVTDYQKVTGSAYENIQVIISTALKNDFQIQEVKVAEQRFSDIAHSTTNWLWETNRNGVFTYTSSSVKDVLGYSPNEILGKSIHNFTLSENNELRRKMDQKENMIDEECWFSHKEGKSICVFLAGKPVFSGGIFSGYRGAFKDVTEQKIKDREIEYLAYNDILTDIPNRTLFLEKLEEMIGVSHKRKLTFAFMFIDLNKFKYVNDTYGHAIGDLLLQKVSQILQKSTRSNDIVARLGGDEFTVLLPNAQSEKEVLIVVNRIIKEMREPIKLNSIELLASLSIGICMFPHDGDSSDKLMRNADDAMYLAKEQGRNQYVFFDKGIEEKNNKRLVLESLLQNRVDSEDIYLNYQPKIDLNSNEIAGFEALVRLSDKNSLPLASQSFIPVAEDMGLLSKIDEIVFKQVCEQIQLWNKEEFQTLPVSINISASQLLKRNSVNFYIEILESTGIDPELITLEIRENILHSNRAIAQENIKAFKEYGFKIALDDFGSGVSSLSNLRNYPIDTIKVSPSFLSEALDNERSSIILKGIIETSKQLGLKIIALGVESTELLKLAKEMNINEAQGFYFHKALSIDEINSL
ncbi:MAG: EAL domain-containing protein [Spirochaetales bacterium]|nr:EAL domain-containing protein [Spirochaetales bacterium]